MPLRRQAEVPSFLQGKVGYRIAPSSDPASPAHLPPKGKALGGGKDPSRPRNHPPSPPSREAGRYGRGIQGRRPGKKEGGPPQGPPKLEKVGPGRKNLFLPGVLSSGFLPKKAGPPPGAGRATGRCAPRLRKSPAHPKGTQYRHPAPAGQGPHQTGPLFFCAILCNFFAPTVYAGVQLWPRFPRG